MRSSLVPVLLATAVFLSPGRVNGQIRVAASNEIGLAKEKLDDITAYLQSQVDSGRIAGAVAAVSRFGRVGYFEAVGKSDLATDRPMANDALFRIASMTKAVTSAAVLSLVEDGAVSLDDPLSRHLPAFKDRPVLISLEGESMETTPCEREPTIRDLLCHRSGLTYGWFGPAKLDAVYREHDIPNFFQPIDETIGDRVDRIAKVPLAFQPGSQWHYSVSTDVLGRVVEVVSGLTLDQFFRERFFRPLKMRDTFFYVPPEKQDRLAALYTLGPDKRLQQVGDSPVQAGFFQFSADYCTKPGNFFSGGGGLVSSTSDYLRFLHMLLGEGELDGVRVLERDTVALMTRNQIGELTIPFPDHGDGFGFGFGVVTDRTRSEDEFSEGSYSWGGIFNTYYWVDPQEQLVGVLMTQLFPYDHLDLRKQFRMLAYEAIDDSGFEKHYEYQPGEEHGNPYFNNRQLRVNGESVSTHPRYATRSEPRSSGMARILVDEDLRSVRRADLDVAIWGGHPGTADKRVSINGRRTFLFPEVGGTSRNCTHQYPSFNLRPADLVNGYNSVQFACDKGETFWGHFIVDRATLRIGLDDDDERLDDAGLSDFAAVVQAVPIDGGAEGFALSLDAADRPLQNIASVRYDARYRGFDENGNGWRTDWHEGVARVTATQSPGAQLSSDAGQRFGATFSTAMLPAQSGVEVRALIGFKNDPDLRFRTKSTKNLTIAPRDGETVKLVSAQNLPSPFWSRADRRLQCQIDLDVDPSQIVAAELHVVAWAGGAGNVEEYFTLNDVAFPVAPGSDHQTVVSRLPVDPKILRKGANEVVLHSDTEHHGIEIMLPGPALMIRYKTPQAETNKEDSAADNETVSIRSETLHGLDCFCITSPAATYYLDKVGGGLAGLIDRDGNDWLSFHPREGSGAGGEYRGFPNAVFKELGSYFHAQNSGTDDSQSVVEESTPQRIVISVLSGNSLWAARYTFTPEACTFTMTKTPPGRKYWVLYEGTPGGQYDDTDWWMTSDEAEKRPMTEPHEGDIAGPEWIAFGDKDVPRMLVLYHAEDDDYPDRFYQMQQKMTVFGFGREGMNKFLSGVPQNFSIGLVESTNHSDAERFVVTLGPAADDEANRRKVDALSHFALTHKGDPESGKKLFHDQRTKCVTCHRIDQQGGAVGPDLSKVGGKFDRPHLIDSLLYPSRQINYGYETTVILTADGATFSGIAKQADDSHVTLLDANNKTVRVAKSEIENSKVSDASIMPTGLAETLTESEFVDLIAYLESLGPANGKFGSGVSGPVNIGDGFQLSTVTTGLSGAVAMEATPDGRLLICEQEGSLRVVKPAIDGDGLKLLEQPMLRVPAEMNWERGLIGVTVAPEFPEDPDVYVVYVADKPYTHHRVSRFQADGDVVIAGSEQILFRGDDQSGFGGKVPAGHQGGGIHIGPDGKLYIGLGEQTDGPLAQRFDALQGKILRLNRDGAIPDDNPFLDQTEGKYQAIWAMGCRNPFTFAFDESGDMLINDVGGKFEEINRGIAGANYGWPVVDHGPSDKDGITGPIHVYPQSSINGGDFCPPSSDWPEQFHGKFFFADFVHGWIKYIDPAEPEKSHLFLSGIRRPVDLRFAADGNLYVLLRNAWVVDKNFEGGTGSLVRVSHQ